MPKPSLPVYMKVCNHRLVYMLLIVLFSLSALTTQGQRNEIGVFFGGSYYLGDLNPHQHFALTRIGAGGLYRFNINPHVSLRINGYYASVEGNDAVVGYNENRNLSFVSNIIEVSGQAEVNFLRFEAGNLDTPHTPYIFAGAGAFSFNPKAERDGRYYALQPLGTEGQGLEENPDLYRRYASSFIFGIGYKFNITRHFTAGLEWGMRYTGTDYLDDVSTSYIDPAVLPPADSEGRISNEVFFSDRSLENRGENAGFQRGNSTNNDWYSFAGFILTFKLPSFGRANCPAFN